jgi:hypothetical protein
VSHTLVASYEGDAADKAFDSTAAVVPCHENNDSASPVALLVVDHWDGDDSSYNHRVDCRKPQLEHHSKAEHSKMVEPLGILKSSRIWKERVVTTVSSWEHYFRYHDKSIVWSRLWSPWNPQVPALVAAIDGESKRGGQSHEDSSPPQRLAYYSSTKDDVWRLCLHDGAANATIAACGHQRVAFSFCCFSCWWEIGSHLGCWQQLDEEWMIVLIVPYVSLVNNMTVSLEAEVRLTPSNFSGCNGKLRKFDETLGASLVLNL